eukprot:CAMPEP_0206240788 /NCGR_PEP_ID=MMETSP0047_2-20121206/16132_1 /ASSEMBLY_ACC=CAM_ASM_000192 /TAXON_ID=195065 /ORGANISM="Chroomonas mesostigmatica_cf, Strain CCMP1168" /LENGTH=113 /DNA_ID=CAMNT_0053665607 /DNA_START=773 /DNA_END=1111 /DNA_ORIENTATION=+
MSLPCRRKSDGESLPSGSSGCVNPSHERVPLISRSPAKWFDLPMSSRSLSSSTLSPMRASSVCPSGVALTLVNGRIVGMFGSVDQARGLSGWLGADLRMLRSGDGTCEPHREP